MTHAELIKIDTIVIGDEEVNSISTRELHEFLEVKTLYASWIKRRLKQLGAIENEDYFILSKNGKNKSDTRGRKAQDYIVTADIGKHLSMISTHSRLS